MRESRGMKFGLCAVAAMSLAAVAPAGVNAKAVAEEIKELKEAIASNSVKRVTEYGDCRYIFDWYYNLCTPEEREAIFDRNVAAHRRWIELEPSNPVPQAELGCVYAAAERYAEAKPELEKALAMGGMLDDKLRSETCWALANCLWTEGDRDGAMKHVDEVAALYGTDKVVDFLNISGRAKYVSALYHDPDGDLDMLKLPHSVDGKPFPTPQKAEYGKGVVSLSRVDLALEGLDFDHPAARLLRRKLERFGCVVRNVKDGARNEGATMVRLVLAFDAPVDKPQGYALEVRSKKEEGKSSSKEEVRSKKEEGRRSEKEEVRREKEKGKSNKEEGRSEGGVVLIKARDRLGLTWGVVSFLQCVQRKESSGDNSTPLPSSSFLLPSICTMRIEDWPKCENRGVTPYWYPEFLEYALFYKMKNVDFTMDRQFILSPLDKEYYRIVASRFADFGLEVNIDTDSIDVRPLPPYSSPRTWKLHLAWSKFLASIGVGRDLMLDDDRFPMHPKDLEAAGTAANLDAKFVTRLYREVKKKYPNFRMKFGAPFYWGPDGSVSYPEPRDEYLKSIAADLDPEIGVFWTGPYVKSVCLNERTIGWVTNLTGRKPTIFHNGNAVGQHNYIQYGADLTGYKESHSTNVFDLVSAFFQNMSKYAEACEVGSCMDWCWNPEAHDLASRG